MTFHTATITGTQAETPLCQHIELECDALSNSFSISGQYAIIQVNGFKDGFFAMSSKAGENCLSFLIKKSSPLSEHLATLPVGSTLSISTAQGKGYAVDLCEGKNILLFAVGSAIAPIRSALNYFLESRSRYKGITLYYGATHSNEFAYQNDFDTWEDNGIKIITTVAPIPDAGWRGLKGFVQDHIPEAPLGRDTMALVCGMPQMMTAVSDKLTGLGLPKENILTNY